MSWEKLQTTEAEMADFRHNSNNAPPYIPYNRPFQPRLV
jgi:hypothetical protein